MANITQTALDDSIPTIVAAEALGYLKGNTVMARLVSRNWDSDIATYGSAVKIPFLGSLSVNDKSADTVVTLQAPTDTGVTVTLDKHKEVSFIIEDIGKALARPDVMSGYIRDALAVVAEQVDVDLTALYSGYSQSIDATAGLSELTFRESRRLLNTAKAPLGDRHAVLHEDAEYALLGIEKFVNADYKLQGASEAQLNAFSGRFMGFNTYMDQKITIASVQAKNMFFHRDSLVLASRPLPSAPAGSGALQRVMSEDGFGLRVTISYNASHLGVQVTVDVLYGVKELRDPFGIAVSTSEL